MEDAAVMLRRDCSEKIQDEIAAKLMQENDSAGQTIKMAMAILVNALVFQSAIAESSEVENVKNLEELGDSIGSLKNNISKEWKKISTEINYRPIYDLAVDVLKPIGSSVAGSILESLVSVASEIAEMGAASQHDFGGQLFQKLINDRKFLASYYTLPSSAAFIAELSTSRMRVDWKDRKAVTGLRIGDFACGTGALLSASYNAIRSRYRSEGADDSKIHRDMMEKVFVGFDIMPAATHLTTSVLSAAHPNVIFRKADIATLLYGDYHIKERGSAKDSDGEAKPETFIGSLGLIAPDDGMSLIPALHAYHSGTGGKVDAAIEADHETFDLVVMNPPYIKPNASDAQNKGILNPAFSGFGKSSDEQDNMAAKRKEIYINRARNKKTNPWYRSKKDQAGEGRAGLGTYFMDLADVKVKPGGVVAFILPATFSNGTLWKKARTLLENRYRDVLVVNIVSSDKKKLSFSDDTSMFECVIIATRKVDDEVKDERGFSVVSIDRRPDSIMESIYFARKIKDAMNEMDGESEEVRRLNVGSSNFGHITRFKSRLSECAFGGIRDVDIQESALALKRGILSLPRLKDMELPIVQMQALGYRRQAANYIYADYNRGPKGPFMIKPLDGGVPKYPCLWSHDAKADVPGRESRLVVKPDRQGIVRPGKQGEADEYWKRYSTRLCFNLDFTLGSQRLASCLAPEKVIGGRAWPAFICDDKRHEKPIVLWSNTTIGLVTFWFKGTRQQPGRVSVTIELLDTMPVYDMRTLTDEQIALSREIFKEFSKQELLQARSADKDPVRQALDRAVLVDLLKLPEDIMESVDLLRRKWCAEPGVIGVEGGTRKRSQPKS